MRSAILAIFAIVVFVLPAQAQPNTVSAENEYIRVVNAETANLNTATHHIGAIYESKGASGYPDMRDDFVSVLQINGRIQAMNPPARYIDAHELLKSSYASMASGAADAIYGIDNQDTLTFLNGFIAFANAQDTLASVEDAMMAAHDGPRITINLDASSSVPRSYLTTALTDIRFGGAIFRWVPKGQTETIPVRLVVCEYPALFINCSEAREASQTIDVTILDVTRNAEATARGSRTAAQWEQVRPEVGEEAVLVHLRVTYLAGRPGTTFQAGEAVSTLTPSLAANGSYGRGGPFLIGLPSGPTQIRSELRIGSSAEGYTIVYTAAGQDFALMVDEHPNTRVLLAAQ